MTGSTRAFSLIETSITVTILAFLVIAMLSCLPTLASGQAQVDHRMKAELWAQHLVEEQKHLNPATFVSGAVSLPPNKTLEDGVLLQARRQIWNDTTPEVWRIRVEVTWKERSQNRTLFRETLWCPVAR